MLYSALMRITVQTVNFPLMVASFTPRILCGSGNGNETVSLLAGLFLGIRTP